MDMKVSTMTGRRNDYYPKRLRWALRNRPLVHVLSGIRSTDIVESREVHTIQSRQQYMAANFRCITIVFDGLDGHASDEPDVGPSGFDPTVLDGLRRLSNHRPTILTRYDDLAQDVLESHLEAIQKGNPPPIVILCPERRRAEWRTWIEGREGGKRWMT